MVLLMDTRELADVRKHLSRGSRDGKPPGGKALALLDAIIKCPQADSATLGTAIYGKPDEQALKYLRIRLWNRLVDSIDPVHQASPTPQLELEHLARCARNLWQRGAYLSLDILLATVCRRAQASESYPVLIDALHLWGQLKRLSHEDSTAMNRQLSEARHCLERVQAAEALADIHPLDFPDPLHLPSEPQALDKIGASSPRLRFHELTQRMLHLQLTARADDAHKLSRRLQQLVEACPSLQEPGYRVAAACHTAHAALHLSLPKQALDLLLSANLPATPCPHLRWQADLLVAEAMRLSDRGSQAVDAYERLLQASATDPSPFRKAARHLLAATAALQAEQPLRAIEWLQPHARDLSLHTEWAFAGRVLHIMTLAELQRLDQAELKIDALRKAVAALPHGEWMHHRYQAAVKVMQRWARMDFITDLIQDHNYKILLESAAHTGFGKAERWPLHEWLSHKCSNMPSNRWHQARTTSIGLRQGIGPK